jgi:hypothetical protein
MPSLLKRSHNHRSKFTDIQVLINLDLPLEIIAIILSFRDNWCGATTQDAYKLLQFWLKEGHVKRKLDWDKTTTTTDDVYPSKFIRNE